MRRCIKCKVELKPGKTTEIITVGDRRLTLTLPAKHCPKCEETYVAGSDAERADLYVAASLLDLGIATGMAFRFMRKAIGLRAIDLAPLLAVDVATISRWETDKSPVDRCALATLAAIASEKFRGCNETLGRLHGLADGRHPTGKLALELKAS